MNFTKLRPTGFRAKENVSFRNMILAYYVVGTKPYNLSRFYVFFLSFNKIRIYIWKRGKPAEAIKKRGKFLNKKYHIPYCVV